MSSEMNLAVEAPDPDAIPTTLGDTDTPTVFGSFWIDRTEFALPVDVIQEMVGEPESFSRLPASPPHMVGVFDLRNTIVPVVDLRILLGFPKVEVAGSRKIAIVEYGEHCIGLLFDEAGGVIYSEGATRVDFELSGDNEKDVVIEGMLKLDGGKRMVQILDPFKLLNLKRLPRVAKTRVHGKTYLGQRLNCISFQLGHTYCALDLRYVQEIMDVPEVQDSPLAHGHILGNIELRGRTIPIVDFRGMMGNEPPHKFSRDALKQRKLLILSVSEGQVGLVVYSIDSIMSFFEADILPFANVSLPRHDIVAGCLMNDSQDIVILLDHQKLLRDPALLEAAKSCREIFPSDCAEKDTSKDVVGGARSTFILFTTKIQLAFDIENVSEIIDRPQKLLRPPYGLSFVDGILNLRGDLITLINPRVLYGLPDPDTRGEKVLIFHKDDKKYGLVVDAVDEIVSLSSTQLLDVPSMAKKDEKRFVCEDVIGCIRVPSKGLESDPVLVLDVEALIARCVETGI